MSEQIKTIEDYFERELYSKGLMIEQAKADVEHSTKRLNECTEFLKKWETERDVMLQELENYKLFVASKNAADCSNGKNKLIHSWFEDKQESKT